MTFFPFILEYHLPANFGYGDVPSTFLKSLLMCRNKEFRDLSIHFFCVYSVAIYINIQLTAKYMLTVN